MGSGQQIRGLLQPKGDPALSAGHVEGGNCSSFDRYQAIGGNFWKGWVGLDHGGAVLVMRNLDVRQIYEMEFVSR